MNVNKNIKIEKRDYIEDIKAKNIKLKWLEKYG
jgi:hypothetical protein